MSYHHTEEMKIHSSQCQRRRSSIPVGFVVSQPGLKEGATPNWPTTMAVASPRHTEDGASHSANTRRSQGPLGPSRSRSVPVAKHDHQTYAPSVPLSCASFVPPPHFNYATEEPLQPAAAPWTRNRAARGTSPSSAAMRTSPSRVLQWRWRERVRRTRMRGGGRDLGSPHVAFVREAVGD
jgi:hypothetical protein